MGALSQTEHIWGCLVLATSVICLSCTTTLDPTSLDESMVEESEEPESAPNDPADKKCASTRGMGGSTFSSCADLPPCSNVGDQQKHLLCPHVLSYDAASYECQLRGGHLAEVDSAAENSLIADAAGETVRSNVWLGGRRSETFVWAWEHSQTVFWRGERNGTAEEGMFVPWQPGEPNNTSTVSDEPEKCLALTLGDLDWNDRSCSLELPFVCEMD